MTDQTPKIALITGGSRGLGRNTAESLARKGVDSVITYNSRADEAKKVVAAIEAEGRKAVALQLDTGDVNSFAGFALTLKRTLKETWRREHFDFLVNNAGTSHHNSIEMTTEAEFDALYNVHLKGVFFLTQKLLPLINDGGRIVNLSSGLTRIIMPGSAPYASMKGAVETLTKYMAKELGPRKIRVNAISAGAIRTFDLDVKNLALADAGNPADAERFQGAFDGLALRVEDSRLQGDGDAGFHFLQRLRQRVWRSVRPFHM